MWPNMPAKENLLCSSYQDTLQKAISHLQDSDAAGVAYQKMLSSFAAEDDISSQETCHILHELPLVKSSCLYRNIYVAPDEASENVNFAASEKDEECWIDTKRGQFC